MNLSRLASRALYWSALSAGVAALLQLLQLTILARILAPADFGLAAMVTLVVGFANAFADVGLSNAILTFTGLTPRILSSLYWIGMFAGAVLACVVFVLAPVVASAFGEPRVAPLVAWASPTFLIAPIGLQFQLLLQRELRFKPVALIEILAAAAATLVTIGFARRGTGALSFVLGALAGSASRAFANFLVGHRKWPVLAQCAPSEVGEMLRFGAYQTGERALNFLTTNVDKIAIGWLLGAPALGLYNVAYQLMQKPLQLVQPVVTRIATPLFVRIRDDNVRLTNAYRLIIELAATVLFPAFAALAVLADSLVAVLLGEQWQSVVPVLRWLSLLGALYAIGSPIGGLLIARGRADWSFWINVWRLVLYAAAILVGSRFGLIGLAIAVVAAQSLGMFPLGFWLRSRLTAMSAGSYLRSLAAPALIAALAAAASLLTLAVTGGASEGARLSAGAACFALVYGICTVVVRKDFILRVKAHFLSA